MPFWTRSDADRVTDASAARAIMPFIMRRRNESAVQFELVIDAAPVNAFLAAYRERTQKRATLLHLVVAASARILEERPRLNRFVAGGRIWQRRGMFVSLSAKKEKSDRGELVALKREIKAHMTLADLIDLVDGVVGDARANKQDQTDKELAVLLKLPTFLLSWFVSLAFWLDQRGLLPHAMIAGDPLFSSVFIANLGSIGMDAPFHHLYEWGNIPLFCAIGQERDDVTVIDGACVPRRVIPLRFTFDERVEDGLYCLRALERLRAMLADPASTFGA